MSALRFERLTEHHVPAILAIEQVVHSSPWSERSFVNELSNPQSVFLTALADGDLVGYGGIWLCIDEAHVTNLAVSPDHQRKGFGKRLLTELLDRAKDLGMLCSTLEVRAGNKPAIAMYEQAGYIVAARRKRYYPDNHEDAIVMWLYHLDQWKSPWS